MIHKINKIKNLGIFDDYSPLPGLKDFKKYNLLYGWNGTGKTTLTRLFDSFETGISKDYSDVEFEIENDQGVKFREKQPFTHKIRVFNQDYVNNNLQILDGKAKAITLILGSASKEIVEETEKAETELARKNNEVQKENIALDLKMKAKGKSFTDIAKTIYVAITGGATRTYRKNDAEADFLKIKAKQILGDEELAAMSITVKQVARPAISALADIQIETTEQGKVSLETAINSINDKAKVLLGKQVESIVIERLKGNAKISAWVEDGIALHQEHNSKSCEFCGQKLLEERIIALGKHFNEADKELKNELEELITFVTKIDAAARSVSLPDSARFYDEMISGYQSAYDSFKDKQKQFFLDAQKVLNVLEEKKSKTTENVVFEANIAIEDYINAFESVKKFIALHNEKTAAFDTAKVEATQKLKNHYLSSIFDEVVLLENDIVAHQAKIKSLTEGNTELGDLGTNGLKQLIATNRNKISSTHKACADINEGLKTFLGRQELIFEPHKKKIVGDEGESEIEDGYIIKRNGKVVTNLSEGEKTAIAFVYFTIHLNDPSFDKNIGIVAVDDPISSLDSNSIFQAFSFLKNAVKDCHQVFIFTHNFDFLRLVLNWLNYRPIKAKSSFYMVKNKDGANGRSAFLDELDKDLHDHESEYHYLFKLLHGFHSNGTIASVYHMPNIARKVLETFLMFRVPNSNGTYQKMDSLKHLFDENKLTAIYKFTNDQSHITGKGFDPCLVPETQNAVKYLLEFIETTFPEHYKILTTTPNP